MRLKVIEERNSQQRGAVNLVEWLVKNWPGMLGFVLLLAILLRAQGKL